MRFRKLRLSLLDRLGYDVDAPVTLVIDRAIWIAQDVADVSAKIENVLAAPV